MRLWDPATGKELLSVPSDFLEFSRDGKRLAYVQGKELGIWEVADPTSVCRVLAHRANVSTANFSPDNRLLASAAGDGIHLWDAHTGESLSVLRIGRTIDTMFDSSGEHLAAVTGPGVIRWPLRRAPGGTLHVGPGVALRLPITRYLSSAATDANDQTLAVVDSLRKALIADLKTGSLLRTLTGHDRMNYIDVSPDGRWAATATFKGVDVKVWNLSAKNLTQPVASFRAGDRAGVHFTRDGRWLVVTEPVQMVRFYYRVGSWGLVRQERFAGGEGAVFSSAEGLIAVAYQGGRGLRLLESITGQDWATLPVPPGHSVGRLAFNHDGSQVAAIGGRYVDLWDLRALRRQLADIDLDWDRASYPALPKAAPPLTVTVEGMPQPRPAIDVVALPPPRPPRRAKPEELAAWIARLSDPDPRIRENAATALEEVGPPALKALDDAARHPDATVRERVKQVHDRIAVVQSLNPRRYSLKLTDVTVADAVATLAAKTGVRLEYVEPPAAGDLPKKISLELKGVPFLEALDRLCQTAGMSSSRRGASIWVLQEGNPTPGGLLAYAGPLRMQAVSVGYQNPLDAPVQNNQPPERVRLQLLLTSEARSAVLGVGPLRVLEARDNTGRSLLPDSPGTDSVFRRMGSGTTLTLLLEPPPQRGGKLEQLKIALPVEITAGRRDVLTVPDLARAAGKTFYGSDGIRLKVQAVNLATPPFLSMTFTVSAPDGSPYGPSNLGVRLTEATGREHLTSSLLISRATRVVRAAGPEHLIWMSASGQVGFPAQLPWAALAPGPLNGTRQEWSGSTQFVIQTRISSPVRLTLFRFDRLRTELPFEFHDLRLP
jgi:WD40 repeat protein